MIVQAMWDNDSPLKQLPHITQEIIERIKKEEPECQSIMDFLDLDDKVSLDTSLVQEGLVGEVFRLVMESLFANLTSLSL